MPEKHEAWSTNYDICRVPIAGGKVEHLTMENKAADGCPRFSPDGKKFAYRAQTQTRLRGRCWQLMVVDCDDDGTWQGTPKSTIPDFDRGVDELLWANNTQILYQC